MSKQKFFAPLVAVLTLSAAPLAMADHNSKWGEGWANMPNETHNTRLDTRDDNEEFLDYVSTLRGGSAGDAESGGGASDSGSSNSRGGTMGKGGPRT